VTAPTTIESPPQGILVLPEEHFTPSGYPDPERKIRVLLVDDHAVVRQGIVNLLGDELNIEAIGEAVDGQEAVELTDRLIPDVNVERIFIIFRELYPDASTSPDRAASTPLRTSGGYDSRGHGESISS